MLIVCGAAKCDACCIAQPAFYILFGNYVGIFAVLLSCKLDLGLIPDGFYDLPPRFIY